INGGRIKSVHTENRHIDVVVTVSIYSIGIPFSVSRQPRPTSVHEIQPPGCRKCRHVPGESSFPVLFSTSTFPRTLFDTVRPACSKDIVCPLVVQRGEGRVRTICKFYQIMLVIQCYISSYNIAQSSILDEGEKSVIPDHRHHPRNMYTNSSIP